MDFSVSGPSCENPEIPRKSLGGILDSSIPVQDVGIEEYESDFLRSLLGRARLMGREILSLQ